MKPVEEFQEVVPGLFFWEGYNPAVKADCSCCALKTAGGLVFVDPLELREEALEEMDAGVAPAAIVLTNGNHERAARSFAERFDLQVFAHAEAAGELALAGLQALSEGAEVIDGIEIVELPGAGPGEIALVSKGLPGVIVIGDALINIDPLGLTFLPDKYCLDSKQARRSIRKLCSRSFEIMTFAHGRPIITKASNRLRALLDSSP